MIVDAGGVVWVTDFGLAKTGDAGMTHTGDILGTMRYMSPERFQGQCDVRADIYALGLTLYELLVLRPAFQSPDRLKLVEMIRDTEPPSPRRVDPRIPRDLETIVLKSIDKDPKRRYQSADELSEDLRRYVEDKPIKARRVSLPERLVRWSRRNRGVAASLAAIGLLLVATAIGSTIAADYYRRQGKQLEVALDAAKNSRYELLVSLAGLQLDRGNIRAGREMLLDTPPEYRNWEWGGLVARAWPPWRRVPPGDIPSREPAMSVSDYWSAWPVQKVGRLPDHDRSRKSSLRFTRDGTRIVTAGVDGSLALRDVRTGEEVAKFPRLGSVIHALALSHDDKYLAAGEAGGEFYLFDMETESAKWFQKPAALTQGRVRGLWFSPDDARLIATYDDGTVSVVDTKSGNEIHPFTKHTQSVHSVRFLGDGERVLSATGDGTVLLWELETGMLLDDPKLVPSPDGRTPNVVKISPSGREIAAGYPGGGILLWNRETGKTRHLIEESTLAIKDLAFSRDGTCLFVAEGQQKVKVLNTRGKILSSFEVRMTDYGVNNTIAVHPDGTRLATNSHDGFTTIFAPVSGSGGHALSDVHEDLRPPATAHDDLVLQAAFSDDNQRLVTASYDKVVRVWDSQSRALISEFNRHGHEVLNANFSPDGKRVASVDSRGMTYVWDAQSEEELFSVAGDQDAFFSAASSDGIRGQITSFSAAFSSSPFAPSGDRLVVNTKNGMAVVDATDGRLHRVFEDAPRVGWPVISPDGKRAAVITGTLEDPRVWDLETGKKLYTLDGHERQVIWIAFNQDGSLLVTGSMDRTAIIWDAHTGERTGVELRHPNTAFAVRFSPDGKRIATASGDGTVKIWALARGELLATLVHGPRLTNVEFSPDGTRILTTAKDNILRIWAVEESTGRALFEFTRDHELLYATWSTSEDGAWTSDHRQILTCWGDGAVHLLEAFPWEVTIDDSVPIKEQVRRWREGRSVQWVKER